MEAEIDPGAVLALASQIGGEQWGPQFQLGAQYAAELNILLVYLSESLGSLSQNGGHWEGPHFSLGGGPLPPVEPPLDRPATTVCTINRCVSVEIVLMVSLLIRGGEIRSGSTSRRQRRPGILVWNDRN